MSRFPLAGGLAALLVPGACGQPSPPTSAPAATPAVPAATPATTPGAPMSQPATPAATPMPGADAHAAASQPGADIRTGLLMLAPYVAQLAKAPALQADARVQQLSRQLLAEATALEQGPPTASLQPTLRTLAALLTAAQQQAYPTLAGPTRQLAAAVQPLPAQPTTGAEQAQYRQVLGQASGLLRQFIAQTPGAHR